MTLDRRLGQCLVYFGCMMYMQIRDIGSGNFGVAKLMRCKKTGEEVAIKFIERGDKVRESLCGMERLYMHSCECSISLD